MVRSALGATVQRHGIVTSLADQWLDPIDSLGLDRRALYDRKKAPRT